MIGNTFGIVYSLYRDLLTVVDACGDLAIGQRYNNVEGKSRKKIEDRDNESLMAAL